MNDTAHTAFIAMGSNLGDRRSTLHAALQSIDSSPAISVVVCSSFIETRAVTCGAASSADPQPDYLNAAAKLQTSYSPRDLLDEMLALELASGRERSTEGRWAPRTLDLDLLFYDDLMIDEPGLVVPHPRLHLRRFVLEPMAQIAPDFVHPALNCTIAALLERLAAEAVSPLQDP